MNKPDLTGLTNEQVKYVEYLESCLNGSSELIQALNTASKVFADDLNALCDDDAIEWVADGDNDIPKSKLIFLSGDAKDKTFDRIMTLFDKFDKIKALSQHFKGVTPIVPEVTRKMTLKPGENVYEHAIAEVKNKNGSTGI